MSALATPLVRPGVSRGPVRRNPVVKLAAAGIVTIGLLLTLDALTPALVLAVEVALAATARLRWGVLARRAWPVLIGLAGLALTTVLFTTDRTGTPVADLGPIHVTTGSLTAALAIVLRVFAIGLAGITMLATTDPTEFADALVEHWHAPARFTFGALAAFRLFPLLGDEWRVLMMAGRARGVDAGRSPLAAARLAGSALFGLLVAAIRRGVRLAAAMDARGFGRGPRTLARPRPLEPADWAYVLGSVVVTGGALGLSAALGFFHPVFW